MRYKKGGYISQIYGARWWANTGKLALEEYRERRRMQNFEKDRFFCEKVLDILQRYASISSKDLCLLLGAETPNERSKWRKRFERFAQRKWIHAERVQRNEGGTRIILSKWD